MRILQSQKFVPDWRLVLLVFASLSVTLLLPLLPKVISQSLRTVPTQKEKASQFVPGEVLVKFKKDSPSAKASRTEVTAKRDGRQIPLQLEQLGPVEIVEGLRLVRVPGRDAIDVVEALKSRSDVLYAEPNFIRRKDVAPNDPRYGDQWSLKNTGQFGGLAGRDIKAEPAWDITTGSRSVVVGIVDEGIDINHADLKDNIWQNPAEISGNSIDDDNNGFIDDINGWDFFHNDNTVFDYQHPTYPPPLDYNLDFDDHGTHVAGTLGATGNNGVGMAGVNWQVSLLPLKFLGPAGGSTANLIRALAYAKSMRELWSSSSGAKGANIRVLNNSYGGYGFSQAEFEAIQALNNTDILFVASAGNESRNTDLIPHYPSGYDLPNIISVAATSHFDFPAGFSNFGPLTVHMAAPGVTTLSTTPRDTYFFASGSSMAVPHVSGGAALIYATNAGLTLARVRAALLFGGDELPILLPPNSSPVLTGRRLNLAGSLQNAAETDLIPPAAVTNFHIASQNGRSTGLTWNASGEDGTNGRASLYELRYADIDISNEETFAGAYRFSGPIPGTTGQQQSVTIDIPFRHTAGFIGIRAIDNAGQKGPISVVPVSVALEAADPFTVSVVSPEPLSTGGTPLGLKADDRYGFYQLPQAFRFFGVGAVQPSTNGALYFNQLPLRGPNGEAEDYASSIRLLNIAPMVAGIWDDLRTDRRPGDDVYVVTPDPSRIIFRWQALTADRPIAPGVSRGETEVNFEIELQQSGTIIIRYGNGNQNLFPVVGLGPGQADAYPVASHTSEFSPKDLTQAQTIVFTPRVANARPAPDLSIQLTAEPDPVSSSQTLTYRITASNNSNVLADQTTVVSQLSPSVTFVSCFVNSGSCSVPPVGSSGTVTINLGALNDVRTIFIVVQVPAAPGSVVTNTTNISSFWTDPITANNSVTVNTDVVPLLDFSEVRSVSAGGTAFLGDGSFSLALRTDGTVWGWGVNNFGQLGDGTHVSSLRPVQVSNLTNVTSVIAKLDFALALKDDGTVWGWGRNAQQQLGPFSTVGHFSSVPIQIAGLSGVVEIAAGEYHGLARKADGSVWGWGDNSFHQISPASTQDFMNPVQIDGVGEVTALASQTQRVLALKSDGTVWTWGGTPASEGGAPAPVTGLADVVAVSGGWSHSLALKRDGSVWGWGSNSDGQIGGSLQFSETPLLIAGLSNIVAIDSGHFHNLALRADGTVWAWGRNNAGQLGNGAPSISNPIPGQVIGLTSPTNISAGGNHSLAVLPDRTVVGWGSNGWGELGDGTTISRFLPTKVNGIQTVIIPFFDPFLGSFTTVQNIRIVCPTPGATIHYTTNGADPTVNDPVVASGGTVLVDRTLTLRARAFKPGLGASLIRTVTYTVNLPPNPIDNARNFIRHHYIDFLAREPDPGGWDYWTSGITDCGSNTQCIHNRRIDVSAAFFIELEFQQTGYVVHRLYRAAFGTWTNGPTRANVTYGQFNADRSYLVAGEGLTESTVALVNNFVLRRPFLELYPENFSNADFVNNLFDTAGLVPFSTERQQQIDAMNNDSKTRAQVLLDIIEIPAFKTREYNGAFVLMQYFGYLRRDPDQGGYDFWLGVLNNQELNNYRGMVCAFLTSAEYQRRFGTTVTRTDRDCGQ